LKRASKKFATLYTNRPSGRNTRHRPLLTFDSTSSKNRIIGIVCSVASTLVHRRLSEYHFST
jgi:hypothetical protein